jgi:hypothetical protein
MSISAPGMKLTTAEIAPNKQANKPGHPHKSAVATVAMIAGVRFGVGLGIWLGVWSIFLSFICFLICRL